MESGGYSSLLCTGFSLQGLLLLRSMGSRAHRFQELLHMGSVVAVLELWSTGSVVMVLGLFSSCGQRGLLFVAMHRFLIAVASLVAEHGL